MKSHFSEFKTLLKILPLEEQIKETDEKISEVRMKKIEWLD